MKQSLLTKIAVLGGGVGGVVAATLLAKKGGKNAKVMLFDKVEAHTFSASLLWSMVGKRDIWDIQRPLAALSKHGISFIHGEVVGIDVVKKLVRTDVDKFPYDYLIISLGAQLAPEFLSGLLESGYNLYDEGGIGRLAKKLAQFARGKIAIVITSLPFKCPGAPYEAAFLLDAYFQERGVREKITIDLFTPEPFPLPVTGEKLGKQIVEFLTKRNIRFHPIHKLLGIDIRKKKLLFENGLPSNSFDLLLFVPAHKVPEILIKSGFAKEGNWIPVDPKTLKTAYKDVFAIGDCVSIALPSGKPLPKAGVFAHRQAEVVAKNLFALVKGEKPSYTFDGHGYCIIETGWGKAVMASGNFYAQPLPAITLRNESRLWHLGKLLFEKYWLWRWF